jgi:ribosomal protein S27E
MNVKKMTVRGKEMVFRIPEGSIFCEKCETTNFIYDDMKKPLECDNCGEFLNEDMFEDGDQDAENKS